MHDSSWEKLLHDLLKRLSCVKRKKRSSKTQKTNLYSEEQLNQQHLFLSVYLLDRFFYFLSRRLRIRCWGHIVAKLQVRKKNIIHTSCLKILRALNNEWSRNHR